MPSTPTDPRYKGWTMMRRLWRGYLAPHLRWLIVAVVLMIIEGSTVGLLSYSLQPMFDRVLVGREEGLVWIIGGAIFLLFLIRAITGVLQRVILTRIAQRTSSSMQIDLVEHLMTLDSTFFQDNSPGALMERVQGDVVAIQNVWQQIILGMGRDIVALGSLAFVAISIDPIWTLAALVGIPLLVLPTMVLQRYVRRKSGQLRHIASQRSTRLDEIFHGINPIKLNRLEDYQLGRFREIVLRIVTADVKTAAARATLPSLIDIITGLGFCAVLILGASEILSGEKSVGEFMSFFTAMALAFQPLR
ncbi:MAG: ABC transporter ATP-binding protein, partial [Alphaproteobacteria bacterium]|nr:ABC transporter ATP-binding protein [Alphaproteobacteria bacterium]